MAAVVIPTISVPPATENNTPSSENNPPPKAVSEEDFNTFINDPRLNRLFELPAELLHGLPQPFQISYADYGFHREAGDDSEPEEEQVLLFFGPLLSSRLWNAAKDELAKRYRVRLVNVERPGIGKTTSVPAGRMLEVWRVAIPTLLNHLGIKHVSIGCHSGGTVYGLDFAVHNPQFLYPSRPYIAIASPWIHSSHSGMLLWSAMSSLPASLVSKTDKLASFVNSTLRPLLGVSAPISGSMGQLWSQRRAKGREGPDVDFEEGLRSRIADHVFESSVRGLGQEAQVLLRNGAEKDGWSDWGDFDVLAPRLAEAVCGAGGAKLRVDVFFAEKDHMIGDAGTKGNSWFEDCWNNMDAVCFTSETVKGADHDNVWDLRWGIMERVFKTMIQDI